MKTVFNHFFLKYQYNRIKFYPSGFVVDYIDEFLRKVVCKFFKLNIES